MSTSKSTLGSKHDRSQKDRQTGELQIREYEARYYPGGRDVAAALWDKKFPANGKTSSETPEG